MPSKSIFLCCTCDTEDKYSESYARAKARGKHSNGTKATWTRRSLLEHEQSEFHDLGHPVYPISHKDAGRKNGVIVGNDQHDDRRRRAQEVFRHHDTSQKQVPGTTFPWMNEDFNVSNGRSVTHLGISSVKINAKRNEQANKNNFHRLVESASAQRDDSRKISLTSVGSNESQNSNSGVYRKPMIRTNATQNNVRTTPNGYQGHVRPGYLGNQVLHNHGNAQTYVNNDQQTLQPQSQGQPEKPLMLHAPSSDVAVRVTQRGSHKAKQIPKLGDYLVLKPESSGSTFGKQNADVRQGAIRAPIPTHIRDHITDNHSDISFTSEITFRKANISFEMNDLSLKRSNRPGIFSNHSNHNTYERLSVVKGDSNASPMHHAQEQTGKAESMYGYVPKAVQSVHASNALSGGKLDDFFLQRMNDTDIENFGTVERKSKKDWSNFMDANYLGDTGIKEMAKTGQKQNSKMNNSHNNSSSSDYANTPKIGLQQIRMNPQLNKHITTCSVKNQQGQVNYVNTYSDTPESFRDENENKVIMIDFPPNLSKNKKNSPSKDKDGLHNGNTYSENIPLADILSETDQVLY